MLTMSRLCCCFKWLRSLTSRANMPILGREVWIFRRLLMKSIMTGCRDKNEDDVIPITITLFIIMISEAIIKHRYIYIQRVNNLTIKTTARIFFRITKWRHQRKTRKYLIVNNNNRHRFIGSNLNRFEMQKTFVRRIGDERASASLAVALCHWPTTGFCASNGPTHFIFID